MQDVLSQRTNIARGEIAEKIIIIPHVSDPALSSRFRLSGVLVEIELMTRSRYPAESALSEKRFE